MLQNQIDEALVSAYTTPLDPAAHGRALVNLVSGVGSERAEFAEPVTCENDNLGRSMSPTGDSEMYGIVRRPKPPYKKPVCLLMLPGLALVWVACSRPSVMRDVSAPAVEWPTYGNDAGSSRYSPLSEITTSNVGALKVAWTYRTGDVSDGTATWAGKKVWARSTFEATPLMVDGTLYVATSFNRIIALDPETGREKWVFDPKLNRIGYYGDDFTCRGLATWIDNKRQPGEACRLILYEATQDGRLIAVDARTGTACAAFGNGGEVSLQAGINLASGIDHIIPGEYHFTSAPAVVGDVVVVGSAINDNDRIEMPSGKVRGYNARTGELVWAWDPVPRDTTDPARATWQNGAEGTGAANVWGPLSADPDRDLVFLPTTSPSPDYYGGERKGANRNANSVVALRASTGKLVWAFQAVHHDVWDYDLPSGPSLIQVESGGRSIAALAQASKMGHLFVLDRDSGQPVLPVEERPVPQGGVPGELLSPTQPFPTATPRLVPDRLEPQDAWGVTRGERAGCSDTIAGLRRGGIFTPPSLQGTLQYPGNAGGTNWGGLSFDRGRGLIVVNQTSLAFIAQLIPREQVAALRRHSGGQEDGWEYAPMKGTPYVMRHKALLSRWGLPCNPPPWGTLAAVEASTGKIRWQVPLGTVRELAPIPLPIRWGTPTLGGPLTTAGGVTFIGATMDSTFRAFDTQTGARTLAQQGACLRDRNTDDIQGARGWPPIRCGGRRWARQSERDQAWGFRRGIRAALDSEQLNCVHGSSGAGWRPLRALPALGCANMTRRSSAEGHHGRVPSRCAICRPHAETESGPDRGYDRVACHRHRREYPGNNSFAPIPFRISTRVA